MQCFMLEPTNIYREYLRRYSKWGSGSCPLSKTSGHNASVVIADYTLFDKEPSSHDRHPHDDARWPKTCKCGYVFQDDDEWQYSAKLLYLRSDNRAMLPMQDAPPGAMWYADWLSDSPEYQGLDGHTLVVRLPDGHDWMVDGRASNCDSPCKTCGRPYHAHKGTSCMFVESRPHKCWVRHGIPPMVHVDKNGVTCGAGAGSIASHGYHGFLHNGQLTES